MKLPIKENTTHRVIALQLTYEVASSDHVRDPFNLLLNDLRTLLAFHSYSLTEMSDYRKRRSPAKDGILDERYYLLNATLDQDVAAPEKDTA